MSSQAQWDQVIVDIAKYVYHYEIQEPESFQRARLLLLDSLGCAINSLDNPLLRQMIGPYAPGAVCEKGFHLPGTSFELDPVKGAFDMAAMIRYLDHNDALPGMEWGHPSDNLGAIIAVIDWLSRNRKANSSTSPPPTIRNLLVAMIKAYEIQGTFQVANSFNSVGIDHTILVKVASTAVVSWLLGLSEQECCAAVSQAWMDGHPLRTYRTGQNTIPRKGWAAGDACMRAVHLAWLTKAGQPGAPTPLTGRSGFYDCLFKGNRFSLPDPYTERVIHRTVVKLFACEGHVITAAEAAFHLHNKLRNMGIAYGDINKNIIKIEIRTQRPAMLITDKPASQTLTNAADRDHDMRFIVALVLLKGHLPHHQDYANDSSYASDDRIDYLRGITTMVEDETFTKAYYNVHAFACPSAIKLQLADSSWTEEVVVRDILGVYDTLDGISLKQKLHQNLSKRYSKAEILDIEKALQDDNLPIHELLDLWWRPNADMANSTDGIRAAL